VLKISITIPSHNSGEFIERAIQSILSQDYPDIECIIMDGGSTDGTLDILKKYEDRIIWKSEEDKGQSDAINKGLAIASGDIIAELDADDVYEKGAFKKVAQFFEGNQDIKWIYGRCRIINEKDKEMWKPITWLKTFLQKRYSYNKLLVVDFIGQPAVFYRKELVDEIGFFDVNDHLVMDYEYLLRTGKKYSPAFIDEYLASWRIHTGSKSSLNSATRAKQGLDVAKRYTNSKIIFILHYLAYLGIVLIYFISKCTSRLSPRLFRRTTEWGSQDF
jgi:glycosyltransferase involved in cell wall biosynthesis